PSSLVNVIWICDAPFFIGATALSFGTGAALASCAIIKMLIVVAVTTNVVSRSVSGIAVSFFLIVSLAGIKGGIRVTFRGMALARVPNGHQQDQRKQYQRDR